MKSIPFSIPTTIGSEIDYVRDNISQKKLSGKGKYSDLCEKEILKILGSGSRVFMTSSCTDALEASGLVLGLRPGDEVIMPSFTFVTTATSFALRGINIKFVDIDKKTLNIDPNKIESAINSKTKAIVCVHYAGVSCDMDRIMSIAKKHGLFVIEDAAQCMFSYYKKRHLGKIGQVSAFSFHDTKNLHCGEGGSLVVNEPSLFNSSDIVIEKGTNRKQFLDGNCEKYTWIDLGSSYVMSDLTASFLLKQLEKVEFITQRRLKLWNRYLENLSTFKNHFELPYIPEECHHNGHIFRLMVEDEKQRLSLMNFLKKNGIQSTFHFVPLHTSPGGKKFGYFVGEDENTTSQSKRLIRLPIFDSLSEEEVDYVCEKVLEFYHGH